MTLTALKVLVYAQMEGGVKDLAACLISQVNKRRMPLAEITPRILKWRNLSDLDKFRAMIDFDMLASLSPFSAALQKSARVRPINRRYELNQMDWRSLKDVYNGFGLDTANIEKVKTKIDQIMEDRNQVAHHGQIPATANALAEKHLRENAEVVENVLTDMSLQLLGYFGKGMHRR